MPALRPFRSAWLACLGSAALLAACNGGVPGAGPAKGPADGRDSQLAWARAALDRNPRLEVLAVDEHARIFTVRLRDGGEVRTVRLEELVAGPPPAADSTIQREAPAPGAAAASASAPAAAVPGGAEPPEAAAPAKVVVEREGGKVRISGPGVSITSAEPSTPGSTAAPGSRAAGVSGAAAASAAPAARAQAASPGVRRVEPLICQGSRELRLDGAYLDTRGNAVEVELGCRLFLTNSRIIAGETGIVVRRGGEVHLANTTVEGRGGAVSLAAGADLYTATSTFRGGLRREPGAEVHDLGSNAWR